MKSPVFDDVDLEIREIAGVRVAFCPKSGGVFLRAGELNKIARRHEGDLEYSTVEELEACPPSERRCPACPDTVMRRARFLTYSEILVDYCPKCGGMWLEKGELEAINAEIDKIDKGPDDWRHALMVFLAKLPF